MPDVFNVADIIGKTLIARTQVSVYKRPDSATKPIGYVVAGNPVGVVYSWVGPDRAADGIKIWWIYTDSPHGTYYSPHEPGIYDVNALRQQGVLSTKEKIDQEADKNLPWYERLIKQYGIWVVGGVVAAAAVKGYLSRSK